MLVGIDITQGAANSMGTADSDPLVGKDADQNRHYPVAANSKGTADSDPQLFNRRLESASPGARKDADQNRHYPVAANSKGTADSDPLYIKRFQSETASPFCLNVNFKFKDKQVPCFKIITILVSN